MHGRLAALALLYAAAASSSLAQQAPAGSSNDEDRALEEAFDPPGTRPAPSTPEHMDKDLPPPVAATQPRETEEERAERELEQRLTEATTDAELATLSKEAAAVGPAMSLKLAERRAVLATSEHIPAQGARARAWRMTCGPGSAREESRCRERALEAMREAGGASKGEAARLEEADRCLASIAPGAPDRCVQRAIATYKKSRDRLMVARATLASLELDDTARRRAVLKLCPEPRCAAFRAAVLEQLAADALVSGESGALGEAEREKQVEQAVRDALEAIRQRRPTVPASERLYARTGVLDRACAALERQGQKGRCRVMEHQALGGYVFRDFSLQDATAPEGLTQAEAREATEHFSVLLIPCLQLHGEKSGSGRYKVSWTILNDGRVTNVDVVNVDPDGRLMWCLKDQFTRWRYPRYRGEWQHVDQEFRVTGAAR